MDDSVRENYEQCAKCLTTTVIWTTQTVNRYYSALHMLVLVGILMAFSIIGGYVFQQIEATHEKTNAEAILTKRGTVLDSATNKKDSSSQDKGSELTILQYEGNFIKAIQNGVVLVNGEAQTLWSFGGSVYFCMTTYTLLGYGNLAPKSNLGRVIAIVYSGFCIPIASLIIGDIGEIILQMLEFTWRLIARWNTRRLKAKDRNKSANNVYGQEVRSKRKSSSAVAFKSEEKNVQSVGQLVHSVYDVLKINTSDDIVKLYSAQPSNEGRCYDYCPNNNCDSIYSSLYYQFISSISRTIILSAFILRTLFTKVVCICVCCFQTIDRRSANCCTPSKPRMNPFRTKHPIVQFCLDNVGKCRSCETGREDSSWNRFPSPQSRDGTESQDEHTRGRGVVGRRTVTSHLSERCCLCCELDIEFRQRRSWTTTRLTTVPIYTETGVIPDQCPHQSNRCLELKACAHLSKETFCLKKRSDCPVILGSKQSHKFKKSFEKSQSVRTFLRNQFSLYWLASPLRWFFVIKVIKDRLYSAYRRRRYQALRSRSGLEADTNNSADLWEDPSMMEYAMFGLDDTAKAAAEHTEIPQSTVPILMTTIMGFVYIGGGSIALSLMSDQLSFFDCFWFMFISTLTVGYGDVVPADQELMIFFLLYIFICLSLMSNVINEISQFFNANVGKIRDIGHDAVGIIKARKEIEIKKEKSNMARRHWKIVRDRVKKGRIPKRLIQESRTYKAKLLAEERDNMRWAFKIYFQYLCEQQLKERPPSEEQAHEEKPAAEPETVTEEEEEEDEGDEGSFSGEESPPSERESVVTEEEQTVTEVDVVPELETQGDLIEEEPILIITDHEIETELTKKLTWWQRLKRFVKRGYTKTKTFTKKVFEKIKNSKLFKRKKKEEEEEKEEKPKKKKPFYFV